MNGLIVTVDACSGIEECLRIFHVPEDKQEEYRKAVMEKLGLVTCQ